MKKKLALLLAGATLALSLVGCGNGAVVENAEQGETAEAEVADETDAATEVINIAYQYGLAYAPLAILQQEKYIESEYEALTGKSVEVVWNQMNSGADINTGIASGSLDVGFMGVGPAITGVSKKVGYKIFTNLSGQEFGLTINDADINTFDDLVNSDKQIALVNIGSIQHIVLAKTLADNGYDAHALDANIVAMKHPDGMTAMESANVAGHLTNNPYIFMERDAGTYTELSEVSQCWPVENSFIVGVASEELNSSKPELYSALCSAVSKAIDYVNENKEETAKITCELDGNTEEIELDYLNKGNYSIETKGVFELAQFMAENQFIDSAPAAFTDLAFDNVIGD